jgi:hypothetical protein
MIHNTRYRQVIADAFPELQFDPTWLARTLFLTEKKNDTKKK